MDELLDLLNPEQRRAVLATEGPVLVLAGAGSGKTRVLTHRVAYLLREGLAGDAAILAVTFTNKAAREMRERLVRLLGGEPDPAQLQVGTFHAWCARFLRRAAPVVGWPSSFTIYDGDDTLAVLTPLVGRHPAAGLTPREARARISAAKNALVGPEAFAERSRGLADQRLAEIYKGYQDALRRSGAVDFDDLLRLAVEALRGDSGVLRRERARFTHLLVDEYQDTNHAQYRLVQLLAEEHRNLCVVGDDDQSIYAFRGADVRNILEFERDFPETTVVRLEQNYRSTRTILAAAHGVVSRNTGRKPKELWTENPQGDLVDLVLAEDDREEAREIASRITALVEGGGSAGDAAVLYRTNAQSRAIEDALRRARIPHRIVAGIRFYERREVKDAVAYLRAIDNPQDDLSFRRVVNTPRRGIGERSVGLLAAAAETAGVSLQEAARRAVGLPPIADPAVAPRAPGDATDDSSGPLDAGSPAALPPAPATALRSLLELLDRFRARAAREPVAALAEELLEESGLMAAVRDGDEPDAAERAENLRELVASAVEFGGGADAPDLPAFLQEVALLSEADTTEVGAEAATLLTLHNAKGLEFGTVFIAGLEEGLLPLTRADAPGDLEEERRLFYVGLTRARQRVVLTSARRRARHGWSEAGGPSRFLSEIPSELLRIEERHGWRGGSPDRAAALSGARGRWFGGRAGPRTGFGLGDDGFTPDEEPDYDVADDLAPRFAPGERVRHARFGAGTVRRVSGFGADVKVDVRFDDEGDKTLIARLARLERET